jgi:hypothetical protein
VPDVEESRRLLGLEVARILRSNGVWYGGQFAWAADPRNVTVRSDLCGWATRDVTLK